MKLMTPMDHAEPTLTMSGPPQSQSPLDEPATAELAAELIRTRQTVLPKRLLSPGPNPAQLRNILEAAAAAPDHGKLTPWRFVIVPTAARVRLARVFEAALLARDASATPEQLAQASEKSYRAPLLMLAIAQTHEGDSGIDATERLVSAGCAIQNMLLMATALGFGSALTSGKALGSEALAQLFELKPGERALCFISIGTVASRRPPSARPALIAYVSELTVLNKAELDRT
jgi:nitroreductase